MLSLLMALSSQAQSGWDFAKGVGIQLKNEDTSAAALNKVEDSGSTLVRKAIYWETNEPTPGNYDWSQADGWINDMEAKGFTMIITIVWNNRDYEPTYKRAITTQAGRDAFANYVADVVDRYKGKDIIWEIWNEPNLNSFWYQDGQKSNMDAMADEYSALVQDAVPAMKTADPNCRVAVCSISALWSQSFDWFQRCIDQGLLTVDIDYISVHPYGFIWPERAIDPGEGYSVIRQKLDTAGATNVGIISSEVGYSEAYITNPDKLNFPAAVASDVQADLFVRQNLVYAMAGIEYGIWYDFTDSSTKMWGMLLNDHTERPAYTACQVLTAELSGYTYQERIDLGDAADFALLFENGDGDKKLVVWTSPSTSMPAGQRFPNPHAVDLQVGVPGDYVVTDIYGGTTTLTASSSTLNITITGSPQYIPLAEEVSVYTNIAPLATLDASRLDNLSKLTDGDYTNTGRWYSGENWPEWIELDFGEVYAIDQVFLDQQTTRLNDWSLEAWDGSAWVLVSSGNHDGQNDLTISFSPIATDKLRLNFLTGDAYLKVFELEVYGEEYSEPPVGNYENVALGKSVTASKPDNAVKVTDGDYTNTGRWFSNQNWPEWVEIDLGGSYTIDQIAWIQQASRTNGWTAEIWDGSAWVQVASGNGDGIASITATFAPVSTTKVRFNVLDGDNYLKLYEMEVYGTADP